MSVGLSGQVSFCHDNSRLGNKKLQRYSQEHKQLPSDTFRPRSAVLRILRSKLTEAERLQTVTAVRDDADVREANNLLTHLVTTFVCSANTPRPVTEEILNTAADKHG